MTLIADLLIAAIALLHAYICWFEMFAWETRGPKAFPGDPEKFRLTKDMAFNQGAYNGFLSAGLVWALLIGDAIWADRIAFFFLACVAVAGVIGALSVTRRILAIQTVPAVAAILLVYFS